MARKKLKRVAAKKPRTLNAVWADARCWIESSGDYEDGRHISLWCDSDGGRITAKQALRLSQWLAEAAAWKGEE